MASRYQDANARSDGYADAVDLRIPAHTLTCLPWRALEGRIAEWDRLALDASEPNPFFESWYLLPSLLNLPATDAVQVLCFEEDGRLAGLMPITRSPRYYRWPVPNLSSWVHDNCFCGVPLVARGAEVAFWLALLRWADANPGSSLFLHMRGITENGPLHTALTAILEADGRPSGIVHHEARAMLASELGPDAYLEAAMSGKKRKELRRQTNRLAERGLLRFERRHDTADIGPWADQFLALERSGWKGQAGSAMACDPGTAALLRQALDGAAARGRLERLTLSLDDRPIAMLATFLTPPGAYSFKTAFDEEFAAYSPGVLLQRENLVVLDRPDIAWTDSCASADHPMIERIWREKRGIVRLSIAIGGPVRRAAFQHLLRAERSRVTVEPAS
ncbi:GNAT family N-acetyltransferase [Novosphingobium colocasiae]|uniref:BioF2-like acetyltransferase domain-containing protein n=1 Tax=Novosphingobium colocasiae TaxID=1256513 RepID=A0A918PIE4_9SPHN|nr:GNAT family N-acetyltransferase [Novosphingobium colocasiae]GGZ10880.1 hypothetical protein GCM10011614_27380 [Novosphingobium colocasiae]